MAIVHEHMRLARALPGRLQRFFKYNPPTAVFTSPKGQSNPIAVPESEPIRKIRNPFSPHKNPATGRWHPPLYSLRQQAELTKMARYHGVEELLPFTIKNSAYRHERREEMGLRVKGTGVGQKVKGHIWERTMVSRLNERRQAMINMPRMIYEWRLGGRGRGWKKWPK